jgi:hypothetical protein
VAIVFEDDKVPNFNGMRADASDHCGETSALHRQTSPPWTTRTTGRSRRLTREEDMVGFLPIDDRGRTLLRFTCP